MRRYLNTGMAVLAADLQVARMELVGERHRLLRTISYVRNVIPYSKIDDQENDPGHSPEYTKTDLHTQVKTACEHYHPSKKSRKYPEKRGRVQ